MKDLFAQPVCNIRLEPGARRIWRGCAEATCCDRYHN